EDVVLVVCSVKVIVAAASGDGIDTVILFRVDIVVARACVDGIGTVAGVNLVHLRAGAETFDQIIPAVAVDCVIPRAAVDVIGLHIPVDKVITGFGLAVNWNVGVGVDDIVAGSGVDRDVIHHGLIA